MHLKLMSFIFGSFARLPLPSFLLVPLIRFYALIFNINVKDAELDIKDFKTLDAFFVRSLKQELRPVSNSSIISPADGKIVEVGTFSESNKVTVKGLSYSLKDLFSSHSAYKNYLSGSYSIIYLSPSDYHCVHSVAKGTISETIFISGHLRTVNPTFSSSLGKTLVENERTISLLKTEDFGLIAIIMVGATNVGSIELDYLSTSAHPKVSLNTKQGIVKKVSTHEDHQLEKGELLGRFHLGSTVIVCFENKSLEEKMLRGFSSTNKKDFEKILFGQNLLVR